MQVITESCIYPAGSLLCLYICIKLFFSSFFLFGLWWKVGFNSATYSWRDWLQKYIFFNYKAQGHIYISSCRSKPLVPHWPMSLSLFFSPLYSICPPEIFASPLCSLHLIHHLLVLWETGLGFYRSRQMCQQPCSQRWKLGWAEPHNQTGSGVQESHWGSVGGVFDFN